ncbi:hypothetical protein [Micromonospora sp. NPDC049102]|uniref:hypothetical protein n=1 Tax=Micromonospora sp. NPDC049102 TaxID=3364265 RepID=UPI0037239EED
MSRPGAEDHLRAGPAPSGGTGRTGQPAPKNESELPLVGGHPVLDLVNTLERGGIRPVGS